MKLVVGLGNIGDKYANTRHNIGFMAIDEILKELSCAPINKDSFFATIYKTDDFLFAKPSTYMNLSGKAVEAIKKFYKIDNDDIIVIHDDLDLKLGALRFKKGGSSGGHNGLKSIDEHIGNDYHRVRIGIGRPTNKEDVVSFVLGKFESDQQEKLTQALINTKQAIFDWDENVASKYSLKG
ncbi:MAG: aminoacyl-tRNA hydrolase [Epsilonproteobacteria bacterium]|nr:aminoacyl-tRNA hydrolase [Campylobacterota bacterium]